MNIINHYLEKTDHSERTHKIAHEAYEELKSSRITAVKVLLPTAVFVGVSSLRKRNAREILGISLGLVGGGMTVN